jgi:hypothetical protein
MNLANKYSDSLKKVTDLKFNDVLTIIDYIDDIYNLEEVERESLLPIGAQLVIVYINKEYPCHGYDDTEDTPCICSLDHMDVTLRTLDYSEAIPSCYYVFGDEHGKVLIRDVK